MMIGKHGELPTAETGGLFGAFHKLTSLSGSSSNIFCHRIISQKNLCLPLAGGPEKRCLT
jgi:hypothetical protein